MLRTKYVVDVDRSTKTCFQSSGRGRLPTQLCGSAVVVPERCGMSRLPRVASPAQRFRMFPVRNPWPLADGRRPVVVRIMPMPSVCNHRDNLPWHTYSPHGLVRCGLVHDLGKKAVYRPKPCIGSWASVLTKRPGPCCIACGLQWYGQPVIRSPEMSRSTRCSSVASNLGSEDGVQRVSRSWRWPVSYSAPQGLVDAAYASSPTPRHRRCARSCLSA